MLALTALFNDSKVSTLAREHGSALPGERGKFPGLVLLPTELRLEIAQYLDRHHLAHLSMANRPMRDVWGRMIYVKISMVWCSGGPDLDERTQLPRSLPRADLLLRTIIENPSQASWIEDLELTCNGGWSKNAKSVFPPLAAKDYELFQIAMRGTTLPPRSRWQRWEAALASNNIDAVIALLVLRCTNLRTLSLGWRVFDNDYLETALHIGLGPYPNVTVNLQHLHTLRLSNMRESRFYLDPAPFDFTCFNLPSLRIVEIVAPKRDSHLPNYRGFKTLGKHITLLKLPGTKVNTNGVFQVLSQTPNLETFEYDYRCFVPKEGEGRDLAMALFKTKDTLRHLKLSVLPICPLQEIQRTLKSEHCFIRGLRALETLDVDFSMLLGWYPEKTPALVTFLPPSLRAITFRDEYKSDWHQSLVMGLLEAFLRNRGDVQIIQTVMPKLRRMTFVFKKTTSPRRGWSEAKKIELQDMCTSHGLDCTIETEFKFGTAPVTL